MKTKTRKFIRSAPFMVAALAIVGALAVVAALGLPQGNPAEAQAEPFSVTATPGNVQITLGWPLGANGVTGLTGFEVEAKPSSTAAWPDTATAVTVTPAINSPTVTGTVLSAIGGAALVNGTPYDVRVRATTNDDPSGWVTRTGITPADAPQAFPADIAVTPGAGSLTVTWTNVPPASNGGNAISEYHVRHSVDGGSNWLPDDEGATLANGGAITGLRAVEYTVQVRAANDIGESTWSGSVTGTPTTPPASATLTSSATTGGAAVKLTLTVTLTTPLTATDWVEIYLEDDYLEPSSINRQTVTFVTTSPNVAGTGAGTGALCYDGSRAGDNSDTCDNNGGLASARTNDGEAFAASAVEIDDGGEFADGEEDAVVISAKVPDMDPRDNERSFPVAGQVLTLTVAKAAGVRNPTEEGSHSVGFAIVRAGGDRADVADKDDIGDTDGDRKPDGDLETKAKVTITPKDGGRSKVVTVKGTGFNNGTEAEVFVLVSDSEPESCKALINHADSESLGTATVESNDQFSIDFTVHQDEFDAGKVNYICARDAESEGGNRYSSDFKVFELKDSLTISPATVAAGDEVTLKPRDFKAKYTPSGSTAEVDNTLQYVYLGGTESENTLECCDSNDPVQKEGSDYVFDMPGGYSDSLRITVEYSDGAKASASITVAPASINLSKTEVAPNESIVITGDGFSEGSYIRESEIKIDGQPLVVDESGTEEMDIGDEDNVKVVKTTSGGTFSATVRVWSKGDDNPALDDGTYKIKVKDGKGFEGSASITVKAPTLMVHPEVAGPRDYIKISGANWPVSTSDADQDVDITIDEGGSNQPRTRSTGIDSTGRFHYEYQLRSTVQLGKDHTITVKYDGGDGGNIEEEITFAVPSSNVTITPESARPGDTITLELTGMPIIELVDAVIIDGSDRLHNVAYTTDSNGDVTVEVVVPYADPGFYPVRIVVEDVTAIVQLEILSEPIARGAAVPLPDALTDLGENLEAVFYFDNIGKTWAFFDPRPEFAELNTLTEVAENNPYWLLIKQDQDVVLNGETRSLSCVASDCWNLVIW